MPGVYCPGLRMFNQRDLEIHEKLGEGAYGAVYRVREKQRGKWLAVKKIGCDWFDHGLPPSTMREVATLAQLPRHPNVVALEGVLREAEGETLLCYELCRGGDLSSRLDEANALFGEGDAAVGLPLETARHVVREVARGVAHLHYHNVVHRDLKPANVLVDPAMQVVKVCDFGMARCGSTPQRLMSREAMTLYYRAPEVVLSDPQYGAPCDVWAAGLILCEVLSGALPFDVNTEVELLVAIFRTFGTPTEATWPGVTALPEWQPRFPAFKPAGLQALPGVATIPGDAQDLANEMIRPDPAQRISMREVLQHPFLAA